MGVRLWYEVMMTSFLSISIWNNGSSVKRRKIRPVFRTRFGKQTFSYPSMTYWKKRRWGEFRLQKSRVERRLTTQFEGDTPCSLYEDFPSLLLFVVWNRTGPGRIRSGVVKKETDWVGDCPVLLTEPKEDGSVAKQAGGEETQPESKRLICYA